MSKGFNDEKSHHNRFSERRTAASRNASRIPPYAIVPVIGISGSVLYGYWYFLDEAPFTKRKRLLATSPAWERRLGDQEYKTLLQKYRRDILPPSHRACITVQRVGSRIASAADKFAKEQVSPESVSKSKYTFTVVRSDMANAFVLPNNHVFVMTGLFQFVRDEDELAAVLGHEMAHNLARHAGERMSGSILINIISRFVLLLDPSGVLYTLFLPAATLLHELPHSRSHEIEADHIGIHLAADACYDPRAAKRVFSAMKHQHEHVGDHDNGGETTKNKMKVQQQPPEFISTHPSYDTRLTNFDDWMPEAMSKFNADGGSKCHRVRRDMKAARKLAAEMAVRRERIASG